MELVDSEQMALDAEDSGFHDPEKKEFPCKEPCMVEFWLEGVRNVQSSE